MKFSISIDSIVGTVKFDEVKTNYVLTKEIEDTRKLLFTMTFKQNDLISTSTYKGSKDDFKMGA